MSAASASSAAGRAQIVGAFRRLMKAQRTAFGKDIFMQQHAKVGGRSGRTSEAVSSGIVDEHAAAGVRTQTSRTRSGGDAAALQLPLRRSPSHSCMALLLGPIVCVCVPIVQKEIRRRFTAPMPPSAAASPAVLQEQLAAADEAAEFLLVNVIQAEKKAPGRFGRGHTQRHAIMTEGSMGGERGNGKAAVTAPFSPVTPPVAHSPPRPRVWPCRLATCASDESAGATHRAGSHAAVRGGATSQPQDSST